MSEQEFDARIQRIEEHYGRHRDGTEACRDQEVARLFVECRWTQQKIAKRMGWTHGRVSQRLLFGRYIAFVTACNNHESSPYPLAEATSVDEAKDVRDKAEALRKYFRKREGGISAANQAMELVLRAERKMGELLAVNPDFGRGKKSITMNDLGIDTNDSMRWQRLWRCD